MPLGLQQVAQRSAVDVFHDDVGHLRAVERALAGVVDSHDRRVIERCRGLRFAAESGLERWLSGEIDTKGLDCDVAAEPDVAPPEHLGHASVAEHFAQLVAVAEPPWLSHGEALSLA